MKRFITITIIFLTGLLTSAHECWLQPKKYLYKTGEEVKVDFMAGESFTGEFWDLSKNKAERIELHRAVGMKDLANEVKSVKGSNFSIKADVEGTYLLAMQSNAAYIEMTAEEFNEYLKEEGLDNMLAERRKLNQMGNPSREFYSRYAKVMVQVGAKTDDTFKKKTGLRYEIVPDQNPYTLKTGDHLQCKVFFEGKPAAHSLVKVWSKINNTTFLQNIYTENDGSIRFPISTSGSWMVSSVKMIKSEMEGADYHSLWSSLVFGI
jgi:uncharacterized GH25 family protein